MVPVRQPGSCCAVLACFPAFGDSRTVLGVRPGGGRGNNPVRPRQSVPLPKDAMDRAHEAEQGRGSGVYEGRLGAGFSQAHGAERALARNPAVLYPLPTTVAAAGWSP
jgi:hypothetical protein